MKRTSFYYQLLASHFDQLWFPLVFWLLFVIIAVLRGQAYIEDTTRAYLVAAIPLCGGIMAATSMLEDPSWELRFSTPVYTLQNLLERLLPVFAVQVIFAFAYQLFALCWETDFSSIIGDWSDMQYAWLVPLLSLMGLGCCVSLAAARSMAGALLAGMVWMLQLVAHGWFASNSIGQYLMVFLSGLYPEHPALPANRVVLLLLSFVLFFSSWLLLQRQERYL